MVHAIKSEGALGEVVHGETVLRDGTVKEMEMEVEVDVLMRRTGQKCNRLVARPNKAP